jgi:flagellar biosynthesis protein FliR
VTDFAPIAGFGLLLARPGMLIMTAPAFGGSYAPFHMRVGLTVVLGLLLAPVVPVPAVTTTLGLGLVIARELAIGLAFALGLRALIAGAELGGQLSGIQLMLSYGSVIDPQGGVRNNIIGTLYGNLTLLTIFIINGHHAFLRSLTASYTSLPIGSGGLDASLVRGVTDLLGIVFVLGFRLAAPLIVAMLVVELASGIVSRTAPAINLMAISTPVRLIVGLLVVAGIVGVLPSLITRFATTAAMLGVRTAGSFR